MSRALMLHEDAPRARVVELEDNQLPDLPVTVDIERSGLNYKDALAITGRGKIVRELPFVPGIDLTGRVVSSESPDHQVGDEVILTGWGVGERHWGGLAERMRVKPEWLVARPEGMSAEQAMAFGTAGLTAMLCVMRLEEAGLTPQQGPVIVTGATGGVGSWAVQMLAELGFEVHAVSGKAEQRNWLMSLGAYEVHLRSDFEAKGRPLEKSRWAGAVDTAGGQVLANLLAQMHYDGKVAAVGLAAGADLPTSVMPFILRGVSLLGVDSVMINAQRRQQVWQRLASLPANLHSRMQLETVGLDALAERAEAMLDGTISGRVLLDPSL
ncbi:MDR family oxidoreductase [Cobetia sp. QF-1]|uniref:MDR family oxidoreductase n=1 Tax=Cobetia sp. QF-1 TaxID=1969833 RepID=UPI000B53DBD7|nr:MDR family oxidoreductase [Cobetia sp. QF-1]